MVQDPKKWSQLLCTAWCTYQHWSPGPKLPWKRLYHQLQIGLGHLAANNLTHTKKKSEKSIEKWLPEVAVYNQRVGTSTYFSPHLRVEFLFLALHLPSTCIAIHVAGVARHRDLTWAGARVAALGRGVVSHTLSSTHRRRHAIIKTHRRHHTMAITQTSPHCHTDINTPLLSHRHQHNFPVTQSCPARFYIIYLHRLFSISHCEA